MTIAYFVEGNSIPMVLAHATIVFMRFPSSHTFARIVTS